MTFSLPSPLSLLKLPIVFCPLTFITRPLLSNLNEAKEEFAVKVPSREIALRRGDPVHRELHERYYDSDVEENVTSKYNFVLSYTPYFKMAAF